MDDKPARAPYKVAALIPMSDEMLAEEQAKERAVRRGLGLDDDRAVEHSPAEASEPDKPHTDRSAWSNLDRLHAALEGLTAREAHAVRCGVLGWIIGDVDPVELDLAIAAALDQPGVRDRQVRDGA